MSSYRYTRVKNIGRQMDDRKILSLFYFFVPSRGYRYFFFVVFFSVSGFFSLIFLFLFDIIVLVLLFSIRIEHRERERENPGEACYSLFLSMNDKSTSSNNINNGIEEEDENERRTSTTAITTTTTT